jgi:hypothetical protein
LGAVASAFNGTFDEIWTNMPQHENLEKELRELGVFSHGLTIEQQ